ncbi:LEAF RUST 10 DISEASE-RESISTANCE LOCUS RECEPTOR-LIKE PROTEIN KINASE-like 1.2 [Triticum urartu]|uniref:LEAF RUST 10 DISEASE-RESISTANCE LOCUS RECEPTOR-LIKE PROTEIN KINASE-like 1.2 n=1 Tax=Triticum urartu TaxID=4572 RepID=UPI002043242C|nr:LEAF RUST 10 DISEASE-RESISTANCE LOCUS RECEPTOR-LIKE PROTEIN KINASE-like 1.2 [Triticum urartu]
MLGQYQVARVFAENSSLVAVNHNLLVPPRAGCPPWWFNISLGLGLGPYTISRKNREVLVLYNCTEQPQGFNRTRCADGSFYRLGGGYGSHLEPGVVPPACNLSVVPVLGFPDGDNDYVQSMRQGFLLEWTVPSDDCPECEASGGQCRYAGDGTGFSCNCSGVAHPEKCGRRKMATGTILKIVGAGLGGAVLMACLGCFVWYKRKKRKQAIASNEFVRSGSSMTSYSKDLELDGSPHIFTFEELEVATDGFSASRELGDGGFGTVYKGKLKDGRVVAVKRLYKNNYRRVEQFLNEVDILSRLLHQNLVILYGCTSRMSRDLLLVYEFIANGTVADHLHGSRSVERGLTWPLRLNISIETAEALAYLHAVEIIHRDVKTTNILLDNSFHVKVADFGLSRLFPLEVTHVSTVPQGTPGYVDPVYHQCYKLTDKSDVYSFGVVLVELISSKPVVDMSRSHSEINLANMALNRIQNHEVVKLIDPELGYDTDPETKRTIDCVAEVAFQCLQLERDQRPSIKEVVEILTCVRGGDCRANSMKKKASQKEDASLLKDGLQFSPDTVIHRFYSQSTNHSVASNASGLSIMANAEKNAA